MNKFPAEFPKICAEFGRGALRVEGVMPKLGEELGGVRTSLSYSHTVQHSAASITVILQ